MAIGDSNDKIFTKTTMIRSWLWSINEQCTSHHVDHHHNLACHQSHYLSEFPINEFESAYSVTMSTNTSNSGSHPQGSALGATPQASDAGTLPNPPEGTTTSGGDVPFSPEGIATSGVPEGTPGLPQAEFPPQQSPIPAVPDSYAAIATLLANDPSFVDYVRRLAVEATTAATQGQPLNPTNRFERPSATPRHNPELRNGSHITAQNGEASTSNAPKAIVMSAEAIQAAESKYELAMNELRALRLGRDAQAANFRLTAQSMSDSPYQVVQDLSPENLARAELAYAAALSELNELRRQGPRDPPGSRPIQLRPLTTFTGETMKGESCENWTLEALNWIRNQETFVVKRLLTEPEKIDAVGAFMSGRASNLWLFWQSRRLNLDPTAPTTLVGFLGILRKQYTSLDSAEVRRRRFDTLKQVTSVRDFIFRLTDLRNLMDPVPGDDEFRRRITLGVKDKVRREILKQPMRPVNLDDFMQWVIRIDEALMLEHRANSQVAVYTRSGSLQSRTDPRVAAQYEGRLNAMDDAATDIGAEVDEEQDDLEYLNEEDDRSSGNLNAVQSTSRFMRGRGGRGASRGRARYRGSTSGQRGAPSNRAWTDDGQPICYSCGEAGHISRNCPSKGTSQ
jgi:hypothetical protein